MIVSESIRISDVHKFESGVPANTPPSVVYLMDCMEGMKQYPDNYFDLAVVDPPYGSGNNEAWDNKERGRFGGLFTKYKIERTGGTWADKYDKKIKTWDLAPDQDYFTELFRVSKQQIIWGGNYFNLPPTRCFLIWRKLTISESFSMAMCEYAWASFDKNSKSIDIAPQNSERFHPTQKPVKLYEWIFRLFSEPGQKILDTHLGSGSSRIAANKAKLDFTGFEIDEDYFNDSEKRFKNFVAQTRLF